MTGETEAEPSPSSHSSTSTSTSTSTPSTTQATTKPGKPKGKKGKGGKDKEKEEEEDKKARLRTSEDIYNRIKWDPTLDRGSCLIGYLDRFLGVQEMIFDNWRKNPLDLIPWHRVVYFKINGDIVWDRRTRLDKLTEQY